jgi:Domain of unknown function (DUF4397)
VIRLCKSAPLSLALLALGVTSFSIGCGSGSTQARLMNAMNGESSVNMVVNNKTIASGVTYGTASGYASVGSGSQTVEVQAGGTTLLNSSLSFSGGHNTVLATDSGATAFADDNSTPPSGDIEIRVINASSSIGTADVYVVQPGQDISTIAPTATLAFQAASSYQPYAAGSYEVLFTQTGSKNLIIDSNPLSFSAGQVRTVVSLDGNGVYSTAVLSDLN